MYQLDQLLTQMIEHKASDLHLACGHPPIIRVDGDLKNLNSTQLSQQDIKGMLQHMSISVNDDEFEKDFAYELPKLSRFRVNMFCQHQGPSLVFRAIPKGVMTMEELGLPFVLRKLCNLPNGLVLITGPTGSGKTTTLASMIHHINQSKPKHILTLEDPIEFIHYSAKSLIQQRELKNSMGSFNNALRAALREDPDVILLGEMRDIDTIRLALTAAETGHLVFATLHTSSAPKTINRIIDVFPAGEKEMVRSLLSESLQAVIAQVLLKRKGGGRVAAHEIMMNTPAVKNLIRENKIAQITSVLQTGQSSGMMTLGQSVQILKTQGLIDIGIDID